MAKLRLFHMTLPSPSARKVLRPDGRYASQVTAAVWATSKRAAAEAFKVSIYELNGYCSIGWPGVEDELRDLPVGVVAFRGDLPHDTIDGKEGWVW